MAVIGTGVEVHPPIWVDSLHHPDDGEQQDHGGHGVVEAVKYYAGRSALRPLHDERDQIAEEKVDDLVVIQVLAEG